MNSHIVFVFYVAKHKCFDRTEKVVKASTKKVTITSSRSKICRLAVVSMIQNEVRKVSAGFIAPTFTEMPIYGVLFYWGQLRSFLEATRNL